MDESYLRAFERAKHLSDVVGMLTRLAFLVLLATFVSAQMENVSGITYAVLLCTLLLLGFLLIRLGWFVADAMGKGWTSFFVAKLKEQIGKGQKVKMMTIFWVGRGVSFTVLLGMLGLSISLISYGDTLAKRLMEETTLHTN
ncbi:hypothetical protein FY036_02925 [Mesorhizobium microcysteis]|uniref:Uncharacterized protein n=1 Tax=Neoaquamicrobium microcysteis TaxID=2682781 RepID=A0A5D4H4Q9_9HYPH|nr:hypothetical protein [Mesorhizobium microcysteis]TYR35243.1 hypothetical protein FY036_02925 [Mesorhizobium microcysteis]